MQRINDERIAAPDRGRELIRLLVRMRVRLARFCSLLMFLPSFALAAPFAYITNEGNNNVSVIDIATNTVTATVGVGSTPAGMAVNPAGTRAYVTNWGSNSVSVIDTGTNTVTATVSVGFNPV